MTVTNTLKHIQCSLSEQKSSQRIYKGTLRRATWFWNLSLACSCGTTKIGELQKLHSLNKIPVHLWIALKIILGLPEGLLLLITQQSACSGKRHDCWEQMETFSLPFFQGKMRFGRTGNGIWGKRCTGYWSGRKKKLPVQDPPNRISTDPHNNEI